MTPSSGGGGGGGRLEGELEAARARLSDAQREVESFRRSAHDRLLRGELGAGPGPGPGGSLLSPRLGLGLGGVPAAPARGGGGGGGMVPPLALRG